MRRFVIVVTAVLIVLASLLTWLMMTESGLTSIVNLTQNLVPNLSIKKATGRFYDGAILEQVSFEIDDNNAVSVDKVGIRWQLIQLLSGRVMVDNLVLEQVNIYTTASQTNRSETTWPTIVLPFAVNMADININMIVFNRDAQQPTLLLSDLNAAVSVVGSSLTVDRLAFNHPSGLMFSTNGLVKLKKQYPMDLAYQWTYAQQGQPTYSAKGTIQGDSRVLKVSQQMQQPLQSQQSLVVRDLMTDFHWTASAQLELMVIADFLQHQSGELRHVRLEATGDINGVEMTLAGQYSTLDLVPFTVQINTASRDFDHWVFHGDVATDNNLELSLSGQINTTTSMPTFSLAGQWQDVKWPMTASGSSVSSEQGQFSIEGNSADYNVSILGQVAVQQHFADIKASLQGSSSGIAINQFDINTLGGDINVSGTIDWRAGLPVYQLRADWHDITVPKVLTNRLITSDDGHISLSGDLRALEISSLLKLNSEGIATELNIAGEADVKGINRLAISSQIGSGETMFLGHISWSDALTLEGQLQLKQINPEYFIAQWPGTVSGGGYLLMTAHEAHEINMAIKDFVLTGTVRERPVDLRADLAYSNGALSLPGIMIKSGHSTLSVRGDMHDDTWALNWLIESPDLADFDPVMKGELKAKGDVGGQRLKPRLTAVISGHNISYANLFNLDDLTSDLAIDLSEQGHVEGHVDIAQFIVNKRQAVDAQINLSGRKQAHYISIDLTQNTQSLFAKIDGQLNEHHWQGQLHQFQLSLSETDQPWIMTTASPITLSPHEIAISRHCFESLNGKLCIAADRSDSSGWHTKGAFTAVPVGLLNPFLEGLEVMDGTVSGEFELSGEESYPTAGQGHIALDSGAMLLLNSGLFEQEQSIVLREVTLDYHLTDQLSALDVFIRPDINGLSPLQGSITLPNIATIIDTPQQATLDGQLTLNVAELSELGISNANFETLKGQLMVDMSLAGTLAKPTLLGHASLDNASVSLPTLGLVLSEIRMTAKGSEDTGLEFDYQAHSGQGQLTGQGQLSFEHGAWTLKTSLKGSDVELINVSEAYVIASPDLTLTMTDTEASLTGYLLIPKAQLAPLKFNMPVTPSADVVVISDEQTDNQTQAFPISVDVNVELGDNVTINGVGFEGRLIGELSVTGDTSKLLLGTGELIVKEGVYLAYAQKLAINDGKILFSGGALDTPDLDIKAVRTGSDFMAGLHFEGKVDNPQVSLFSSPAMSQDDVLAHLILGRAIADSSVADAAFLASAATGLGITGGNQLGEKIAGTFGLDTLTISGNGNSDSALQIGKYLSPKLYLGYGLGLFEPVSIVSLRYKLSKIWTLKAESGVETGVDILYTYEK